jgi:hypothetical protein
MSFSKSLTTATDAATTEIIHSFIQRIALTYDLSPQDLFVIWEGDSELESNIKSFVNVQEPTNETLMKANKSDLVDICKKKGLKRSGTKTELVMRILGKEDSNDSPPKSVSVPKKSKKINELFQPNVIKTVIAKIPKIPIHLNQFGNYEHSETSLIFSNKTQKVYGKQSIDGTVDDLNHEDINMCNKYKFEYELPENLDSSSHGDVKVNELDEESDVELSEEEMIEEETIEEEIIEEEIIEEESLDEEDLIEFDEEFEDYEEEYYEDE